MKYTERHRLGDIICDHYQLLLVMSRFGMHLGFGDKCVKDVCDERGVDCKTFLAVINYVSNGDTSDAKEVSVTEMSSFLRLSHGYYLDFLFPRLRSKLVEAVSGADEKMSQLVIDFFDSYMAGVSKHLTYEDNVVFPYVEKLACGKSVDDSFRIVSYSRKHEQIDSMLLELKSIIIKYFPDNGKANEMNAVLYEIFSCEADLKSHCDIEDNLFMPAVMELEKSLKKTKEA